jgi:MoxR-like ATPase
MPETSHDPEALVAEIEKLGGKLADARAAIANRIIGQEQVVTLSLAAMLSGGHALADRSAGAGQDAGLSKRCRP